MLAERHRQILDIVQQTDFVTVKELSEKFNISESSIRKDLVQLDEEGLVERVHGGVKRADTDYTNAGFNVRKKIRILEKRKIAAEAAKLIKDGSVIGLDGSSTAFHLAHCLIGRNITVVTNGIYSALELSQHRSTRVILIGGEFNPESGCATGTLAEPMLKGPTSLKVKQFFTSPGALTVADGLMDNDPDENLIKRLMVAAAAEVIVLADHTKLGSTGLLPYMPISAVSKIITDDKAAPEDIKQLEEAGVTVTLAS